jgi:hypothetical protein
VWRAAPQGGSLLNRLPLSSLSSLLFLSLCYIMFSSTNNYAPRVTVSYADASGLFQEWSKRCKEFVVYEHEADEKVSQTHCHLLMLGCQVKAEQFKRMYMEHFPHEARKGNALWSWVHEFDEDRGDDAREALLKIVTYYSKGKLQPKFVVGLTLAEIDVLRQAWVDYRKPGLPGPERAKRAEGQASEWDQLFKAGCEHYRSIPNYTLDSVRSWTMSWYLKRDGRLPNVGAYKRNAGSLYIRLSEIHLAPNGTPACTAIEEVKNLWY